MFDHRQKFIAFRSATIYLLLGLATIVTSHAVPLERGTSPTHTVFRQSLNMAPTISRAKGKALSREPQMHLTADGFVLENSSQVAVFVTRPSLHLVSLRSEYLEKNLLAHPEQTHLFLTEIDGKRFNAEDWRVQGTDILSPSSVGISLALPDHGLTARLVLSIDGNSLRLGLRTKNVSNKAISWKTAFPQIGGLQLSDDADEDYYLFPLRGGAIASKDVNLRAFYGDGSAWWQMIDVFSPRGGGGFALRSLDATGLFKGIALRKGRMAGLQSPFNRPVTSYYMSADMGWTSSLDAGLGVSMDFEYLKYSRSPGGSFVTPDASLEMHAGDWHQPMQIYADWAHRAWKWRPWPSGLHDIWNIQASGWGQAPLFTKGKWRTDFIANNADASELMSWWQWSERGPWGISMDSLEQKLGKAMYDRYRQYWVINQANGKLEYPLNRGDYDYNDDWGGLKSLKKELQDIRDGGQLPMLYVDPVSVDNNTKVGQDYGKEYGVMNPLWKDPYHVPLDPPGYVANYGGWQMDIDTYRYQEFLVKQVTRIARDTGVDGIRFDEFGSVGYVDFNPRHQHVFAEPGQNAWLQATTRICHMAHRALDEIRPGFVLTSEHVGYDFLASTLEGSLDLEQVESLRPVPLNVFRFYFPEHKLFGQIDQLDVHGEERRFWNASGAFGVFHSTLHHEILKENGDVFDGNRATPLVPTLLENAYANEFEGGGKVITLIYNATGASVDQPLIAAPNRVGFHYFDLLHGREILPENSAIAMNILPDHVATVALLPEVLSVNRVPDGLQIELGRFVRDAVVVLYDSTGMEIQRKVVTGTVVLPDAAAEKKVIYVKLFSGKYLLDARALAP